MRLRRIAKHLQAQDWTAVALDFAIVVIGVFVGIQVANWNDDQAAQKRGDDYIERLLVNLETDLRSANGLLTYYTQVRDSADQTLMVWDSPDVDSKIMVLNAYRASELIYYPSTRSTWEEIVSSGELSLIPRNAVDNGLALYFNGFDGRLESSLNLRRSTYRKQVRGLIPHDVQKAIREGCSDVRVPGSTIQFRTDCTLDLPDAKFEETAAALREDEDLRKALRVHVSTIESAYVTLKGQVSTLERVIALLEAQEKDPF